MSMFFFLILLLKTIHVNVLLTPNEGQVHQWLKITRNTFNPTTTTTKLALDDQQLRKSKWYNYNTRAYSVTQPLKATGTPWYSCSATIPCPGGMTRRIRRKSLHTKRHFTDDGHKSLARGGKRWGECRIRQTLQQNI